MVQTLVSLMLIAVVAGGSVARELLRRRSDERWLTPDGQARLRAAASPEIATLLAKGKTVQAIKVYCAEHDVPLRTGKAVIDRLGEHPELLRR